MVTDHLGVARRRPFGAAVISALASLLILALLSGVTSVWGATFAGKVTGNGMFQSGTALLSDAIGATNCLSSPNSVGGITTNSTTCSTYPLAAAIGPSTTTLSNQGSINPSSVSLTSTSNCGVQEFADTSTAGTNTGLPLGGATDGAAGTGPTSLTDSPRSVAFDGSTGWGQTLTQVASPGPQTFSLAAWIKSSTASSSIIGYTSTQSNTAPTNFDRMIWLDASGHVVFGIRPGATFEVNSSSSTAHDYADGAWHFVVVTVAPVTTTRATVLLYVDGNPVAGSASNETITASDPGQVSAGWWHLGWAYSSGWTDAPASSFWSGSMADVAVFPTALTAAKITMLYGKTTQAALSTQVLADAPTSYWPLQDTGSTTYTGSIANLAANSSGQYADHSANPGTNEGTGEGTLGTDASGPIATTATAFNGSRGWIQTAVGNSGSFLASPGPQTFSLGGWFKTTTAGGSIIGFTNAQSNTGQSSYDRMLWLDSSGHVVFGIYPGAIFEVNSSATTAHDYADGAWHYVMVTVTPVTATTGTVLLYIDGSLVAGSPSNETITSSQTGQTYGGWWHLGWASESTWTDPPTTSYWNGSLGQIAVFPTALSAASVSALAGETTAGSYAIAATGGIATSNAFWPLNDSAAPTAPACSYLILTIGSGATGKCIYPSLNVACPASGLVTSWLSPVNAVIPTTLGSLTFTTATVGSIPATGVGMHVSVPLSITDSNGGFSATLVHDVGYVLL
jgi:hypothetical protein